MENNFRIISDIIKKRRTVKPAKMNGKKIADDDIRELLQLADWAPTHKMTEPWGFIVYPGDKAREFAKEHAELYRKKTVPEKFEQTKYDKILGNGNNVSHIIVAVMKRDAAERIPVLEEIAATSAAIQNILLGATAKGIAIFWSSGGMVHKNEMKEFLGLNKDDIVMGILYLGYSDSSFEGKREIPIDAKVTWK
jgi:nitroreductase